MLGGNPSFPTNVTFFHCINIITGIIYSLNACCPQFDATLATLIGYSGKSSGMLSLNANPKKHRLSDVEKILEGQGAKENIQKICSFGPENLTKASCPAQKLEKERQLSNLYFVKYSKEYDLRTHLFYGIINHMLTYKSSTYGSMCPLVFPNMTNVVKECANVISNETACCSAMDSYALNCVASLGEKLQKANGVWLPSASLPLDATYDKTSEISFICDLNNNIAAPWPSLSFESPPSCKKTTSTTLAPLSRSHPSHLSRTP
ncbi:hypothetical protein DVH24_028185 [Malus domestica]|uniref:At1g61900-like C-terminal domain-containing protein n=1 Tax=Malus domestica TaxID=3750 RepID=A0A498H9B9_MALDO|nr:hypothetical protein DVH24_028185 [Malus domestica]